MSLHSNCLAVQLIQLRELSINRLDSTMCSHLTAPPPQCCPMRWISSDPRSHFDSHAHVHIQVKHETKSDLAQSFRSEVSIYKIQPQIRQIFRTSSNFVRRSPKWLVLPCGSHNWYIKWPMLRPRGIHPRDESSLLTSTQMAMSCVWKPPS